MVKTLKEFHNIFMGQKIKVHTDSMNLIYKSNCSQIVVYALEIVLFSRIFPKSANVVADALSRLHIMETSL
jgi:hypothetical protein